MINTCRRCAVVLASIAMGSVQAAEDAWQHTITGYMVAASIDGKAGVGDVTVDVDTSFSDILDNLDWGAMGAYRGERGPWAVSLDVMYLAVEADGSGLGPLGRSKAHAEGDQLIVQLDGGYDITEHLSAYVGARYWRVDADVKLTSGGPQGEVLRAGRTEDWIDPLVGLRYAVPLGDRWLLIAKGDVGGFGAGSDFSWHATALAAWQVSELVHLLIGYRHIDVDYDDGSGRDRFVWDLTEAGPTLGVAWRF